MLRERLAQHRRLCRLILSIVHCNSYGSLDFSVQCQHENKSKCFIAKLSQLNVILDHKRSLVLQYIQGNYVKN